MALHFHQHVVSVSLNLTKAKALPLGRRNTEINPIAIPYVTEAKILGIRFHATIAETTRCTRSSIVTHIRHPLS